MGIGLRRKEKSEGTDEPNTIRWLLSWLALFLAFAVAGLHLVIDAMLFLQLDDSTSNTSGDWSFGPAAARLLLDITPNLVAVLVVYAFVARVLRARGLDSATQLAESVRAGIQEMAGTTHAPLEVFLDQVDPARFRWDEDFLSKAKAATLVCRFGEDFFDHWYGEFRSFIQDGGRIVLILPNPYRDDLLAAMDTQRADRTILNRIDETLAVVDRLNGECRPGQRIRIRYVNRILSYDIYLATGSLAIQAPYENYYRVGNRPPVSIATPGSDLFDFLSDEALALLETAIDRELVDKQHRSSDAAEVTD